MDPTTPAQPERELAFLRPAITGGLFLGILSTVPYLNLGCCLWLLAGGAMAAFLVNQQNPGKLKLGDGALAGILSGVVGTIISTVIMIPIQTAMYTPAMIAQMREQFKQLELPPDFMKQMEPMFTPGFSSMRLVAWAISFSILGGLFAMIGGILMVAALKRQKRVL